MSNKIKKERTNESLKKAIEHLELDMTMEELGKKLSYSKAAVSKYLGHASPSKSFLKKFEEIFEIDLKQFETKQTYADSKNDDAEDIEILRELINELKERIVDLKESLNEERESKKFFKKEYYLIKHTASSINENDIN